MASYDIFLPTPSYIAPLYTAEVSTEAVASNLTVTLTNQASDTTEVKADPNGLAWHCGRKQLRAAQPNADK